MRLVAMILVIAMLIMANAVVAEEGLVYDSGKKRNPFIHYITNDGQLVNIPEGDEDITLNLEGIFYDKDGQSMVIINGAILRKNDTIGNVRIVDIKRDNVLYSKDGEIFTLYAKYAKKEE